MTGRRRDGTNPRARGTNPRAVGSNPIALGTNPRARGTNPRAVQPDAATDAGRTADALYVRRTLRRAMTRMRARDEACRGCGGRTTLDVEVVCRCEPVDVAAAARYLGGRPM